MQSLLLALIPGGILLLVALPFAYLARFIYERGKKGRRSPITGMLLRSPGQSILPQIDELTDDINGYLVCLILIPLGIFSFVIADLYFLGAKPSTTGIGINIFIALVVVLYLTRKLIQCLSRRNRLRLGYDAELAVGQELNQLMLNGCRVYHDFPAENFNIDHVVVGPGGIYAVETKGRAKPDKGRGKVDAKVVYDGHSLRFPDHQETAPLEQAKRQADWLQKWLSSAVGESVAVRPALALPGWYVDLAKRGNVTVFNGKSPHFLASPMDKSVPLSPQLIQRIAHQLEQRCRDVEPVAYRKEKKRAA
jgi:hypothetical protein